MAAQEGERGLQLVGGCCAPDEGTAGRSACHAGTPGGSGLLCGSAALILRAGQCSPTTCHRFSSGSATLGTRRHGAACQMGAPAVARGVHGSRCRGVAALDWACVLWR